MSTTTREIATDGVTTNDKMIKNDGGCCVYVPTPESPVTELEMGCNIGCVTEPTNTCGLTHPVGSGTLAGCKSTTLPHFGVVMSPKKEGACRQFAYYTSGNTEEYENECGSTDKLICEEVELPCETKVVLSVESCDCFENKEGMAGNSDTTDVANVGNTVVGAKVLENGDMVVVLGDGTEVPVEDNGANVLTQAEADALYEEVK